MKLSNLHTNSFSKVLCPLGNPWLVHIFVLPCEFS
uniref:Uncharacterized protein n=1 Tax=Anguilla anguilla TaxID=7936 RepID=A0A0E9TQS8_ANGAN